MSRLELLVFAIALIGIGGLGAAFVVKGRAAVRSWIKAPLRMPQPFLFTMGLGLVGISIVCLALVSWVSAQL